MVSAVLLTVLAPLLLSGASRPAHAQVAEQSYAENGVSPVTAFGAADAEGTEVVWSLSGNDADRFIMDQGVLSFRTPPDYEAPADSDGDNVYQVTVEISDGANITTADVVVRVTNVEEEGTAALSSLQPEAGIPLTVTLTDPDGGVRDVGWSWESSPDGVGWNAIGAAVSNSYTPADGDVGNYLRVNAEYTDAEGPGKQAQAVSYSVVREPHEYGHAPEFPAGETGTRSVAEDAARATAIGDPVAGEDEEIGHLLTYTLSGADAALFDIDRSSGQLLTKAPLDHEARSSYSLTVIVSDPTNAGDAIAVTVSVANTDEGGAIGLSSAQPLTGAALSSDLRDPDGEITGVSWKWERSEDGMTWAPIGGATSGSYTPAEADVGNYLRVTASYTDGEGSGKGAEAVSANPVREPVDHAPTFPYWENGQREVQENAPAGTAVGAPFTATDADEHKLMYFLLDEHDAGHFTVDEETGQLRTRAPLDYETKHRYSVTLAVHDSGEEHGVEDHGADSTLAVSIIVTDVDESLSDSSPTANQSPAVSAPTPTAIPTPAVLEPDEEGVWGPELLIGLAVASILGLGGAYAYVRMRRR